MNFLRFSIFTLYLKETVLQTGPQISQIGPQDANLDAIGSLAPWPVDGAQFR
jgi:hypothetical protein